MSLTYASSLYAFFLFVGMITLIEVGRQLGQRRNRKEIDNARTGLGAIEGAIFGLMGLLIAFTFSGAASRFDARRQLIVQEANDISTAWQRLDLLPTADQTPLRTSFRLYLHHRLAAFHALPDQESMQTQLAEAARVQREIWQRATLACRTDTGRPVAPLVLPALNAMFDTATSRNVATQTHPPTIVFLLLGTLTLVSALLAGFGMAAAKTRSWLHILGYAAVLSITVYVILDFELPRVGLIRIDRFDHALEAVQHDMQSTSAPPIP